jgi:hypothetical protein
MGPINAPPSLWAIEPQDYRSRPPVRSDKADYDCILTPVSDGKSANVIGETMSPDAEQILRVFRTRGLRSDAHIKQWDFGDVIVWENGRVRDEPVRQALTELFDDGYLIETDVSFVLTKKGADQIYSDKKVS